MNKMDRVVRRLATKTSPHVAADDLQLLSTYDHAANIVLLGDPGAGKTHTFREAAERIGGRCLTARAFLVTPATLIIQDTLFIDALDEKRGGRNDRDTVDAIVEKLFTVSPRKVRISCRVADWLGESDLAALNPYFEQTGSPVVLLLENLSADEQSAVLQAEGLNTVEVDSFRHEAIERGLGDFLGNPQNLIMLRRAVQNGQWPSTRSELFELSTRLMLREFDINHSRSGCGVYTAGELRSAAGAAFATRLISDVEGISLADNEESDLVPSYRGLKMVSPDKMIASLGRRVFVAGPVPESVDYAHRTTAEYLGASWLAESVKNGMPLGRLLALIGIDGHPATELRGIHAWLAVHLPEHADRLIDADPYGVLAYGDVASLPKSSCVNLMEALGRLSQTDPWFLSDNSQSPAIAALSRADMVVELRTILRSNDAAPGLRLLVTQALALAAPMPALKDDLAYVIMCSKLFYSERFYSMEALLKIGPSGKVAAKAAFQQLGCDANGFRLRADMIHRLYGECLGSSDVTALLTDIAASSSEASTGILYSLSQHIPVTGIPVLLDALPQAAPAVPSNRNIREVARFIDKALLRVWLELSDIEPSRALRWLRLRNSYLRGHGARQPDEFRLALRKHKDWLIKVTDYFFNTLVVDDSLWLQLTCFREATLWEVEPEELLAHMMLRVVGAPGGSKERRFFFEASIRMALSMDSVPADTALETLFKLSENCADLRAVREASLFCVIPSEYLQRPARDNIEHFTEGIRAKFDADSDLIKNGSHLSWLGWAAKFYLGMCYGYTEQNSPNERLVAALGGERAKIAIAGFIATLSRPDLPSLADVAHSAAQHKCFNWWLALAAGLIELWELEPNPIGFSDEFLQAMLLIDLTNPIFENTEGISRAVVPNWKAAITRDRPDLAHGAYVALARARLSSGDRTVDAIRLLMVQPEFRLLRGDTALKLLCEFPNADPAPLDELFAGVLGSPSAHSDFATLADRVFARADLLAPQQRDKWLATAYLLLPNSYEAQVEAAAKSRPFIVFDLRDRHDYKRHGDQQPRSLTLQQLEFLARLTGKYYPETSFPKNGWSGDTNTWDAAEFCRKTINEISAIPSHQASEVLRRLLDNPEMASYDPHLRHALANQERRRREKEYDRPNWSSTIEALCNGVPATVADLHALLRDQLHDLCIHIAHSNTDIYKSFWNIDQYSRPETPRPEEACRDTLVTLLRPPLASKGIIVEPEGHMFSDKRADIAVAIHGRKILCELKRDYHDDLWTAADQQLERFYAHDPEAKGFGIYGVFWFGSSRPSHMPRHPAGLATPESSADLEQMLRDRVPMDRRHRIAVIVIDVSGTPTSP